MAKKGNKMAKYNGHKNYNHWNVYLWINNDAGLYSMARYWCQRCTNKVEAARGMLAELHELGYTKTLDGVPYTISSICAALVKM